MMPVAAQPRARQSSRRSHTFQDMLGTVKDHMHILNEAKDKIISEMTILADEEPKPKRL